MPANQATLVAPSRSPKRLSGLRERAASPAASSVQPVTRSGSHVDSIVEANAKPFGNEAECERGRPEQELELAHYCTKPASAAPERDRFARNPRTGASSTRDP